MLKSKFISFFSRLIILTAFILVIVGLTQTKSKEKEEARDLGKVLGEVTAKEEAPDQLPPAKVETFFGSPAISSLEAMLQSLNISLEKEDRVKAFPEPQYGMGSLITIYRSPTVKVIDAGEEAYYHTWQRNFKNFLAQNNIEIGEDDKVAPPLDFPLSDGLTITIVRVQITEVKEKETIDFKTIEKDDPTLEKGKTVVKENGEKGVRELVFRVRRENGKEVSREKIRDKVTKQPITRVVLHGTKIVVLSSEEGIASWTFGGTASRRYKKGTKIRVTNLANGKQVETTVAGYGPMAFTGKILDLNIDLFEQIADSSRGTAKVRVEELNA